MDSDSDGEFDPGEAKEETKQIRAIVNISKNTGAQQYKARPPPRPRTAGWISARACAIVSYDALGDFRDSLLQKIGGFHARSRNEARLSPNAS